MYFFMGEKKMFKIYNTNAITRKQRFQNALVCGISAAIISAIVYIIFSSVFNINYSMSILFVPIGYFIGWVIQKFGRGVQIQFSILAVVLTALVIIVCDLFIYRDVTVIMYLLTRNGLDSLWDVGYRALGLILAFQNARVIS